MVNASTLIVATGRLATKKAKLVDMGEDRGRPPELCEVPSRSNRKVALPGPIAVFFTPQVTCAENVVAVKLLMGSHVATTVYLPDV